MALGIEIERVAVLGGGLMGSGIAESIAVAGLDVVLRQIGPEPVVAAQERVAASLARAVRAGKRSTDATAEVLGRITFTEDLAAVAEADLIIEAVPEDLALKVSVLAAAAQEVGTAVIIASNTSSIPIAQLASAISAPERMLGLHFFSPAPVMRLVEVVTALDTDPSVVAAARRFVERIGKVAIETKDRSGFVVNMLLVPFLMAAVRMYEEGFATREDIDEGVRLGCGHPMGPLTLCDYIGLDVLYSVCQSLYDEFREPAYAPPPLMKRRVASGRFGRKSGRRFYDYTGQPVPSRA